MVDKVLHSQMPFTTGGQTINDRLTAAYHSLAGSQLGKTVCKATTEEPIAPKKKHLDYLLHCTHEPNVSIPQLANFIVERTTNTNWSVVYKALITLHNLMCYGNERFCQYLASSNANLSLGNFLDKTSMQGYDMSSHVRRYAKYISEKVYTYRMVAYDFCKVKRGREDGFLRVMATDKLLKALPLLQGQIDALLEFQIVQSDLANQVINCSFLLMFRDLIRLFACYNDGIINLLEKYFEMNKKQCAEGLELYKKFVERMDKVGEFLKIAESAGVDKGEIPDLVKAPSSLLESLESHLVSLGGIPEPSSKTSGNGRVTSPLSAGQFQPFANFGNNTDQQSHDPFDTSDARRRIFQQGGDENRENVFHEQKQHQTADRKQSDFDLFSPNTTGRNRINFNDNQKTNAIDDLLSLDAPTTAAPPSSTNPFASDFGGGGGAYHQQQQQPPSGQLQPPFASPWSVSPTPVSLLGVVSSGRLSISSVSTPNVAIFLSRNSISSPISNGGGSGAGFLPFANENSFAKAFGSPPKIYNTGGYGSVGVGNVYPEYSAEFQGNIAYSQYAASSRGISPAPEEESTAGHNPFLTDSYGAGAREHGMVDESAFPQPSAEWHAGYDQEPMPKDDQNAHAAAAFNPFTLVQSHPVVQSLDLGGGQLRPGKSPAVSALSSAIPSPAASGVASPMRGFSQPMGIPQQLGGGGGGAFEHANFGAGGMQQQQQYPRFMTPPPQPRAASSYGGPSVFETEMSSSDHQAWNRGPPRPPSAPPTELQGLDPLGDLLTPQPTSGAPTSGAPAPGVLAPSQQQQQQMRKPTGKIIKGDLDSSLASLAENLSIGKGGQENLKKPVQWSASGKPGQQQQQQQPSWNPGAQQQGFPGGMVGYPQQQQQQPMWGQQQMGAPGGMMMGAPMQAAYGQPRPGFGAPPPQAMMYGSGQAPMGGGYPMGGQMPNYGGQPQQQMPQQAGGHPPAGYDPFGAL